MCSILICSHLYHPAKGGTENYLKSLAEMLVKSGYRVTVLTTTARSTEAFFLNDRRRITPAEETVNGVRIIRLTFQTFGRRTLNLLRRLACRMKYPLNNNIRLVSFGPRSHSYYTRILSEKPDLVFAAPLPQVNVVCARRAAIKLKVPYILLPCTHLNDPCSYFNPIFFKIMREADLLVALTESEREFFLNRVNTAQEKTVTIPPAFPVEPASASNKKELRGKFDIPHKRVVLYMGQHGRHKNISGLIEAMELVWRKLENVALVIAGGTTDHTPCLKTKINRLPPRFQYNIIFLDDFPEERKGDIYQLADIFVSLSDYESFGITYIEAMANGLPVVASVHSVARTIVEDFKTGLLVNPLNIGTVSGAIYELLKDPATAKEYGKYGRQKVMETFNRERFQAAWLKRIKTLINDETA